MMKESIFKYLETFQCIDYLLDQKRGKRVALTLIRTLDTDINRINRTDRTNHTDTDITRAQGLVWY
jgi:hypothetical protein